MNRTCIMPLLKSIIDFFSKDKTVYSHRNRSVEMVVEEKGLDIDQVMAETLAMIEKEGPVDTVIKLRKRFHITSAAAWVFVDQLTQ